MYAPGTAHTPVSAATAVTWTRRLPDAAAGVVANGVMAATPTATTSSLLSLTSPPPPLARMARAPHPCPCLDGWDCMHGRRQCDRRQCMRARAGEGGRQYYG